jgi:hypothetical protein
MAMLWTLARNQIAGGIGLSLVGPSAILSISTANRRRQATSGLVWLAYMLAQVVAKGLRPHVRQRLLSFACISHSHDVSRSRLKVSATVFPPDAVIRTRLAPPSVCRASALVGSGALNVVVSAELLR